MTSRSTCRWPGQSGATYVFYIYSPDERMPTASGVYIFAGATDQTTWRAAYIGQTQNFAARIPNHEQLNCASRNGATHIHLLGVDGGENARLQVESDLLAAIKPPCNG